MQRDHSPVETFQILLISRKRTKRNQLFCLVSKFWGIFFVIACDIHEKMMFHGISVATYLKNSQVKYN